MAGLAHSRRLFFFAAGLILAGAVFLRCAQITRRPFHADEGVQAYQTWQLLRGAGYTYDPADKHGPLLYYVAAGMAQVAGWSPAGLDESRLRSVTLLAGCGTLLLMLGAAARLGRGPVLLGAAVLAVAPLAIIYDTYFVQEAWFCCLSWALFFTLLRLREEPRWTTALGAGVLAGVMQATKETSVLHFAALGVALLTVRPARRTPVALLGGALLAAALVYVLFYSAFFTRWTGVVDGLRAYFTYAARAAGTAHDQPWYYYLSLLWPHASSGVRWGEPLLLLAALGGGWFACTARANAAQRALAGFTVTLLLIYSIIPYKMPWLLLTPYVGLALLAGLGACESAAGWPGKISRWLPAVLGLLLLLEGGGRAWPALGRYANDERNPYLYQPTAPDVTRLVAALTALPAERKLAIVSPDHAWPLPWYLRARPATGYFATPPANLTAYDDVVLDSRITPPATAAKIYGLRPNVFLWQAPP